MPDNAAAPAPTGEAAPLGDVNTNSNPAPDTPAEPTPITPEQVAQYLGTTPEGLSEYQKFVDNSGGFDKAFKTYKSRITERPPEPPKPVEPQPQAQPQTTPQTQPSAQPPEGTISQDEFATLQYFNALATEESYAPIADQLRTGEVLKEMAKFGIRPTVNGYFNDRQVRDFLNLYAKTVPATPPSAPVTPTPTVDYVQVGESITSMNQAMAVLAQSRRLEAQGMAPHPSKEAAQQFVAQGLSANANRGRRVHKTLDPQK